MPSYPIPKDTAHMYRLLAFVSMLHAVSIIDNSNTHFSNFTKTPHSEENPYHSSHMYNSSSRLFNTHAHRQAHVQRHSHPVIPAAPSLSKQRLSMVFPSALLLRCPEHEGRRVLKGWAYPQLILGPYPLYLRSRRSQLTLKRSALSGLREAVPPDSCAIAMRYYYYAQTVTLTCAF